MALGWLWVACRPSLFNVRRSASGRNLKHRKATFRRSAVSPAYITRPSGGWSGPKLSPGSLPCMSGDSPMTLPCVSRAPIIGLAYATEALEACPHTGRFFPPTRNAVSHDALFVPRCGLTLANRLHAIQRAFHPAAALPQHIDR